MSLAYKIWMVERVLIRAKCRKCFHYENRECKIFFKYFPESSNCVYYTRKGKHKVK